MVHMAADTLLQPVVDRDCMRAEVAVVAAEQQAEEAAGVGSAAEAGVAVAAASYDFVGCRIRSSRTTQIGPLGVLQ